MSEERKKIYREIARGMKRDEKQRRQRMRIERGKPIFMRWLPLAVFVLLVAGFLFGFVFFFYFSLLFDKICIPEGV